MSHHTQPYPNLIQDKTNTGTPGFFLEFKQQAKITSMESPGLVTDG